MFFPLGEDDHQNHQIIIPKAALSGEVYSPHVLSLQEEEMKIPCTITPKKKENGDFSIKKIEHIAPKSLSMEDQLQKAKKVIDLTPSLSKIDTTRTPTPFFRNLGKMFSLFCIFLTGAIFTTSLTNAIYFKESLKEFSPLATIDDPLSNQTFSQANQVQDFLESTAFFLPHSLHNY